MDILGRLNGVIDYIEDNLQNDENISTNTIAKIACLAPQQFFRVFSYIAGVSIYEYIRHRKLTLAAQELLSTDAKVIDIALKYGYESPDSFTRAFQLMHGISPTAARKTGTNLVAFPRLKFYISIKGDVFVNYKLQEKPAFAVVGRKISVRDVEGENIQAIPEFWDNSTNTDWYKKLCSLCATPLGVMGVCGSIVDNTFDYYIAIEKTDRMNTDGFDVLEVPASTWACFESVGPMPNAIQEVWKYILSEWMPSSGYKHAGTPDLEVYTDGDPQSADYQSNVWIPVVKG